MTNGLPLSHYSRQWLGLVAAKAKLLPTRQGERWLLHLTLGNPHARTVTLHLRWSGVQWQLLSLTNAEDWRTMSQVSWLTCSVPALVTVIVWRVTPYPKRRLAMPKQPIAVELEAINREGETQVVRDSGLPVHGYSVYLRAMEASELALATWVAEYDTIGPAYQLAERLSIALAIPLTVLVPESLMPVKSESAATAGAITTAS